MHASILKDLHFAPSSQWKELTVVPLFAPPTGLEVVSLKTALDKGMARITEVSDSGSVPQLKVFNDEEKPLLILDSTELEGGKQNRMLNTSVLIPPRSWVHVPVSCIEAGRWRRRSTTFRHHSRSTPASMRAQKSMRVSSSLKRTGTYDACQSQVWQEVEQTLRTARVSSGTSSLTAALDSSEDQLEQALAKLPCAPGQTGLAAYIRGQLMGVDLLGQPDAFAEAYRQLLSSYVMDVMLGSNRLDFPSSTPRELSPLPVLEAALRCPQELHPSPGMGRSVRISGRDADTGIAVEGAALTTPEGLVHLAIHPG